MLNINKEEPKAEVVPQPQPAPVAEPQIQPVGMRLSLEKDEVVFLLTVIEKSEEFILAKKMEAIGFGDSIPTGIHRAFYDWYIANKDK